MDTTAAESFHVFVKKWNNTLAIRVNGIANVEDIREIIKKINNTRRAAAPYDTKPTTHHKHIKQNPTK